MQEIYFKSFSIHHLFLFTASENFFSFLKKYIIIYINFYLVFKLFLFQNIHPPKKNPKNLTNPTHEYMSSKHHSFGISPSPCFYHYPYFPWNQTILLLLTVLLSKYTYITPAMITIGQLGNRNRKMS